MPEEKEVEQKQVRLSELKAELATYETDQATLKAELAAFERLYIRQVGILYAELDAIEAKIAEKLSQQNPFDVEARTKAEQARKRAETSERETAQDSTPSCEQPEKPIVYTESLKKLYREVAKRVHPDLADDEEDRARRHHTMAEANRAYEQGDEERLQAILDDWHDSLRPERADDIGTKLILLIRKIAKTEERIQAIQAEINTLRQSNIYVLRQRVLEAETRGYDLLTAMASRIRDQIAAKLRILDKLSKT